jgi:hypothetical protein
MKKMKITKHKLPYKVDWKDKAPRELRPENTIYLCYNTNKMKETTKKMFDIWYRE